MRMIRKGPGIIVILWIGIAALPCGGSGDASDKGTTGSGDNPDPVISEVAV